MQNFQYDLQNLEMDPYQVGELTSMSYQDDPRVFGGRCRWFGVAEALALRRLWIVVEVLVVAVVFIVVELLVVLAVITVSVVHNCFRCHNCSPLLGVNCFLRNLVI